MRVRYSVLIATFLASCAAGAHAQSGSASSSGLIPTRLASPDQLADYVRLHISSEIKVPEEIGTFKCKSLNPPPASPTDPIISFVRTAGRTDITVGLKLNTEIDGKPTEIPEVPLPVFLLKKTKPLMSDLACSGETIGSTYESPLVRTAEASETSISITPVSKRESKLTPEALQLVKAGVSAANWYFRTSDLSDPAKKKLYESLENWSSTNGSPGQTKKIELSAVGEPSLFPLLNFETIAGRVNITAQAKTVLVHTKLFRLESGRLPDLSGINTVRDAKLWKVEGQTIKDLIDAETNQAWQNFSKETDIARLNVICRDVLSALERKRFSSNDATALAWIMIKNHPTQDIVGKMSRPACLEDREERLARFGITMPKRITAGREATLKLLRSGLMRDFMSTTAAETRYALAPRLFAPKVDTFDQTETLFPGGEGFPVKSVGDWQSLPRKQSIISCFSFVGNTQDGSAATAFAIARVNQTELPIAIGFSEVAEGEDLRINSLKVLQFQSATEALKAIRAEWSGQGSCENNERPVSIYPVVAAVEALSDPPAP